MPHKNNHGKGHAGTIRTLIVVAALAAFCVLHPDLTRALFHGDTDEVLRLLEETTGFQTFVFIAILQFVQVLSIVFPGMPIHIAAGVLLGPVLGFLTCYLSFIAANAAVFMRASRSSKLAGGNEPELPSSVKLSPKMQTVVRHLTDVNGGIVRIIMVSILPFFPNGVIPYYAASTKMHGRDFIAGVAIGCPVPIVCDVITGHLLLQGHVILAFLLAASLFGAAAWLGFHQNQIIQLLRKLDKTRKK